MKKHILCALVTGYSVFNYSNAHAQFIPGDVSSVGLTHAVPDVAIWYDGTGNGQVKIGPIDVAKQFADNDTWEPWVSVLGEKVFLIQCEKFVDDGTFNTIGTPPNAGSQRYVLAFQPAAVGTSANAKLGECFYDDSGNRYTNQISSRQNGNPGRVYGDRRYDGTNIATGGEANPQNYGSFFNSDSRFALTNPLYGQDPTMRCGLIQTFSVNLSTFAQTPLCKAFDGNSFGHPDFLARTDASNQQRGRFGGGIAALDNGNFAAVIDDRSPFFEGGAPGNETIALVFKPDGSVVTNSFLVRPAEAWTDPCGFKGGFCVRSGGLLYFYNNNGNLIVGDVDHNALSGLTLDTGRGDGTKIAGDIRTPYVFYAGGGWLTVWNGTNGAYLAQFQYTDGMEAVNTVNRTDVACDSLGNVCVAWDGRPTTDLVGTNSDQSFALNQIMARVFHFDAATTNLAPITSVFFPFVNHDGNTNSILGYRMENSNLDMTTRYICIAGKGLINSSNNVAGGPDSKPQTTVYTVINNPGYVPPKMSIARSGGNLIISWAASAGDGVLQSTAALQPINWADVSPQPPSTLVNGNTYQKTVAIGGANLFLRLAVP